MSLQQNRDYMTNLPPDPVIEAQILSIIKNWKDNSASVEPISELREIMNKMRQSPRGQKRLIEMNTFIRTLGRPEQFATLLDILRASANLENTREQALSEISRKSSKHAVYGWCGQTRLILSDTEPTTSTLKSEPGVQEFLGNTPTSAWSLSMHIWQPNPYAKGFPCGHKDLPNIIAEPPHSHPFDFASVLIVGTLHQCIYQQKEKNSSNSSSLDLKGQYNNISLEHVHGVWPPHDIAEKSLVNSLEHRIEMNPGDSYYMAANSIHDVQVDQIVAKSAPAITLFLRSESYVKPHVYMAPAMAEFHSKNPDLKNQGYPLKASDWHKKLFLVADYVRGNSLTLDLSEVVKYNNEYAFFHVQK